MKVKRIFVEHDAAENETTLRIRNRYRGADVTYLDRIDEVFGRVHKPYLQKRDGFNLYLGYKRGALVKEAPPAYGVGSGKHYYFVHAYNCIFECQYCYLQGYFSSPDLVLFVNHDDIRNEMRALIDKGETTWFHAGEFSDSLALAHLTGEWSGYWDFFLDRPEAMLELRTKSSNIGALLELKPLPNVIISYSLSPQVQARQYDLKAPSIEARLRAISQLAEKGYQIGIHFDPIIDAPDLEQDYRELAQEVVRRVPAEQIPYVSMGVVRFAKNVYRQVENNYPQSGLLANEFVSGADGKVRYRRPHRMNVLKRVRAVAEAAGIEREKIYFCMED